MLGLENLTVLRAIPQEALIGLISGSYSLHGGVVRDVGGRIVAHLAMPALQAGSVVPGVGWIADAFQSYQLHKIGLSLARVEEQLSTVVQLSTATLALSGLNLAVSAAGFAFLGSKLRDIDKRMHAIERDTQRIKDTLDAISLSQMSMAIDELRHAALTTDTATRHGLLMQSKQAFGRLMHQHHMLCAKESASDVREVLDDGYTVAMIGAAVATSELDMTDVASNEFQQHLQHWQTLAKSHCRDHVLGDRPERLLHHRFRNTLPARELVRLLDFAYGGHRGVGWVDELRSREADASLLRLPSFDSEEQNLRVARKLVAKDDTLSAYAAHFTFLAEHGLRASSFDRRASELSLASGSCEPVWVALQAPAPATPPAPAVLPATPSPTRRGGWWARLFGA